VPNWRCACGRCLTGALIRLRKMPAIIEENEPLALRRSGSSSLTAISIVVDEISDVRASIKRMQRREVACLNRDPVNSADGLQRLRTLALSTDWTAAKARMQCLGRNCLERRKPAPKLYRDLSRGWEGYAIDRR